MDGYRKSIHQELSKSVLKIGVRKFRAEILEVEGFEKAIIKNFDRDESV